MATTKRKKPEKRSPLRDFDIKDRFPTDGLWLVSNDKTSARNLQYGGLHMKNRKIGRLLTPMELFVLCGFEQHREVLCKAVEEILDRLHTVGISHDVGATIIIDTVHKAQTEKMKGIKLDESDRKQLDTG